MVRRLLARKKRKRKTRSDKGRKRGPRKGQRKASVVSPVQKKSKRRRVSTGRKVQKRVSKNIPAVSGCSCGAINRWGNEISLCAIHVQRAILSPEELKKQKRYENRELRRLIRRYGKKTAQIMFADQMEEKRNG